MKTLRTFFRRLLLPAAAVATLSFASCTTYVPTASYSNGEYAAYASDGKGSVEVPPVQAPPATYAPAPSTYYAAPYYRPYYPAYYAAPVLSVGLWPGYGYYGGGCYGRPYYGGGGGRYYGGGYGGGGYCGVGYRGGYRGGGYGGGYGGGHRHR